MALLNVENLSVSYGMIQAVRSISFQINAGEIVCLIGANGAGKTTCLQTLSGLLKPQNGTITFDNVPLVGKKPHTIVGMGLAQCPEGRHVFSQMTVEENLRMGGYSQPDSKAAARLKNVYEHFPRLAERLHQRAGTMSGGEQQMLAMARALMSAPKLLMLDEPSMGLAPVMVQEIFSIIKSLHEQGTTILLVEQNAQVALSIADRAYVLETGSITMTGTGAELLSCDAVRSAYLGA